jgi:hypothetical protein
MDNPKVRRVVERTIVACIVDTMIAHGHSLTVAYDGSIEGGEESVPVKRSKDRAQIIGALFACDDEYLFVHREGKRTGWIHLVYGNGSDVISDYSMSLGELLTGPNALANKIDSGEFQIQPNS